MGCVLEAWALVLPVSVSVDCRLPLATVVADQLAVMPVGRPVTLKVEPEALEVSDTPPTPEAVTVILPVPIEVMLSDEGESATEMAGAAVTLRLSVEEAVRLSPVAVILSEEVFRAAAVEALRVSVEVTEPFTDGV